MSQTLAVMLISPSSGTGSGALMGSMLGAIFTTSIATTKVSEIAPSSSVTSSVARCNPEVVYVCSIIEFCPILSNFISGWCSASGDHRWTKSSISFGESSAEPLISIKSPSLIVYTPLESGVNLLLESQISASNPEGAIFVTSTVTSSVTVAPSSSNAIISIV